MPKLIIICNPEDAYREKLEQDVAREYTKMAINDYDRLVSFDQKYLPFVETPDYEANVGKKQGRNLTLTLFTQQPMIRIGDIQGSFISSSYLFNPESGHDELLLPDLDIIQIEGASQVREGADIIKAFYEKFGWKIFIYDGKITDIKKVKSPSERFEDKIEIINPTALQELAKEKVGYSITDLCF